MWRVFWNKPIVYCFDPLWACTYRLPTNFGVARDELFYSPIWRKVALSFTKSICAKAAESQRLGYNVETVQNMPINVGLLRLVGAYDENACTKKTPNKWSWLLTNLNPSGTNYIYATMTITIIILISAIICNYNNYTGRRRLGTPGHSHI